MTFRVWYMPSYDLPGVVCAPGTSRVVCAPGTSRVWYSPGLTFRVWYSPGLTFRVLNVHQVPLTGVECAPGASHGC